MTQENKTPQANRFRFRAWHPVAKTMHPVTGLHFFEGREFVEISVDSAEGELQNLPKNDFILMQSTGLLDKKGVEIFEGDILSDGVNSSEVKWNAGCCKFETDFDSGSIFFHREIIGNIYQHPHLLKP